MANQISSYLYGILGFIFVIMSGVLVIGELRTGDPSMTDDARFQKFNSSFDKYQQMSEQTAQMQANLASTGAESSPLGWLNTMIGGAWTYLRLMFNNFSFMSSVWNAAMTMFGLPWFVPGLIGMAVIILVVFAIYSAIFRLDI